MDSLKRGINNVSNSTKDFLRSNSLVSKLCILILALIIFLTLLRYGLQFIEYLFAPADHVHLTPSLTGDGMVDGKNGGFITPQDPSDKMNKMIRRSINRRSGIEFTWSCWIFIDDLDGKSNCKNGGGALDGDDFVHIFHKGNPFTGNPESTQDTAKGINSPNNGPGLYLSPVRAPANDVDGITTAGSIDLVVIMNTFQAANEMIRVPNMPMHKWFNVCIRCKNTTLDVYVNGTVVNRKRLNGVPFQNYGNIYGVYGGNFDGKLSNLWYWNRALSVTEIRNIVKTGPNTREISGNDELDNTPKYFSLRWFFNTHDVGYGGF